MSLILSLRPSRELGLGHGRTERHHHLRLRRLGTARFNHVPRQRNHRRHLPCVRKDQVQDRFKRHKGHHQLWRLIQAHLGDSSEVVHGTGPIRFNPSWPVSKRRMRDESGLQVHGSSAGLCVGDAGFGRGCRLWRVSAALYQGATSARPLEGIDRQRSVDERVDEVPGEGDYYFTAIGGDGPTRGPQSTTKLPKIRKGEYFGGGENGFVTVGPGRGCSFTVTVTDSCGQISNQIVRILNAGLWQPNGTEPCEITVESYDNLYWGTSVAVYGWSCSLPDEITGLTKITFLGHPGYYCYGGTRPCSGHVSDSCVITGVAEARNLCDECGSGYTNIDFCAAYSKTNYDWVCRW